MKTTMKNRFKKGAIGVLVTALVLAYSCDDTFLEVPVTGQLNQELLAGRQGL